MLHINIIFKTDDRIVYFIYDKNKKKIIDILRNIIIYLNSILFLLVYRYQKHYFNLLCIKLTYYYLG